MRSTRGTVDESAREAMPQADQSSLPRRVDLFAVWLVIGLAVLGVWLDGARHGFLSCAADCGEAFDALQYVQNFHLYGLRYGLVQDMATSPLAGAHPFFYTHNVNIAGILFTFLDLVGIGPFWAKQLFTVAAFGAGLYFVFRATAVYTRAWIAALVVLALFATDYQGVLRFGLNPLRAWHWLAIFGVLYYATVLGREREPTRLDRVAIVLLGLLAFGIGYDLWVICALIGLAAFLFNRHRGRPWRVTLRRAGWLLVGFVTPLLLRQVQIIAVLGPTFWLEDLYFSIAVKVSVLNKVLPPVSPTDLDRLYRDAGVLRPPASPASSVTEILVTLRDMLVYITIPSVGLVTLVLGVVCGLACLCVAVADSILPDGRVAHVFQRRGMSPASANQLVSACRLVGALTFGIVLGMAIFAPLSLHIYLKYQFPLIVGPLLVVKGLLLSLLLLVVWKAAQSNWTRHQLQVGAAALAVCFLVVDHSLVQIDDLRLTNPLPLSWIDAVSARQGATFAVSWIPDAVSVFSHNWAVGVPTGDEADALARLREGRVPFDASQYSLFWERDASTWSPAYEHPDYWLYFPTDRLADFDQPSPTCRQDYLTELASSLVHSNDESASSEGGGVTSLNPERGPPGTGLWLTGAVPNGRGHAWDVTLLSNGQRVGKLPYNCQYGTYAGPYVIPAETPTGVLQLQVLARNEQGQVIVVGRTGFTVVGEAATPDASGQALLPRHPAPQPDADDVAREYPDLPIVAGGHDWLLFDLRGLKSEPSVATSGAEALYVPTSASAVPAATTLDARGETLQPAVGSLVWFEDAARLVRVDPGGVFTDVAASAGSRVRLTNVGPWDAAQQSLTGGDVVYDGERWLLDRTTSPLGTLQPANVNADFDQGTPADPLAGWAVTGPPGSYDVELLSDDSGDFVRIRALQPFDQLLVYQTDPLMWVAGAPLSIRAQIRLQGTGHARLTLTHAGGDLQDKFRVSDQTDTWNILALQFPEQASADPEANVALGAYGMAAGEYFDVRECSVFVGVQP